MEVYLTRTLAVFGAITAVLFTAGCADLERRSAIVGFAESV